MGLIAHLGRGPVGIDTAAFIYWMEDHPQHASALAPLFEAMDAGKLRCVTSELTVLEVTVLPLRAGDGPLAERYESLLTTSRGLTLIPIDREQLYLAARLRARYVGLRTPDAIQVAAALSAGATAFVTNDRRLPHVAGLEVVQLSDVGRQRATPQ